MKKFTYIMITCLLVSGLQSCVSYRKYEEMETWKNQLKKDLETSEEERKAAEQQYATTREQLKQREQELNQLRQEYNNTKALYDQLKVGNQDLLSRYDRILAQNQQLLESSSSEKRDLLDELSNKQKILDERERTLKKLEAEMEQKQKSVTKLQEDLEARQQRVVELEAAIAEKDSKLKALRENINKALLGFSAADLSVREENGKVYVSLSQNLLFPSGSKNINAQGKSAIAKLANVLKTNKDIDITVEGHTDTDGDASYNWDLSVGRATTIVKELTQNGVDPKRITASGRGEFFPVATNETAQGKAQNRRTEIILTPKLDALYKLIGE